MPSRAALTAPRAHAQAPAVLARPAATPSIALTPDGHGLSEAVAPWLALGINGAGMTRAVIHAVRARRRTSSFRS